MGIVRRIAAIATLLSVASAIHANAQDPLGLWALQIEATGGQRSILIGSVHSALVAVKLPDDSVFKEARRYVIEHWDAQPQKANEPDARAGRASWARDLSPAELQTFYDRARCAGISQEKAEDALTYRSVQTANQYAYTVCGESRAAMSRDVWMLLIAARLKVRIDVLEDTVWVENQRHRLAGEDAAAAFHWILQRDPGHVLAQIAEALNMGEYSRLARAWRESFGGSEAAARAEDLMVRERNEAWMAPMRKYLDEGDAVIVVGAMHIPGPNGLIAKLTAEGYKVSQVQVRAAK